MTGHPGRAAPGVTARHRAPVVVLKLGGSILTGPRGFRTAAREIGEEVLRGRRVVAVVSAVRGVTDELSSAAGDVAEQPSPPHLAALLATGEDASVALLGIALSREGVPTRTVAHADLGLVTEGPLLDARPRHVDVRRLRSMLRDRPALVVPGFVGRGLEGATSVLGRGGSDLTALFLAHRLAALECRLVKDVDGLFPRDPNGPQGCPDGAPPGGPYRRASWEDVERLGPGLVQPKALEFARLRGLRFRIAAPGSSGTEVGPYPAVAPRPEVATCSG